MTDWQYDETNAWDAETPVLLDQHEWAEETSHSDPARRWVCGTCGAEQTTPHEGDQP